MAWCEYKLCAVDTHFVVILQKLRVYFYWSIFIADTPVYSPIYSPISEATVSDQQIHDHHRRASNDNETLLNDTYTTLQTPSSYIDLRLHQYGFTRKFQLHCSSKPASNSHLTGHWGAMQNGISKNGMKTLKLPMLKSIADRTWKLVSRMYMVTNYDWTIFEDFNFLRGKNCNAYACYDFGSKKE